MSDHELADDLFGGSEGASPPPPPAVVASGSPSRQASPIPSASGSRSPAKPTTPPVENDEEEGGMDDLFGDEEASAATPQTPSVEGEERNPLEYEENDEVIDDEDEGKGEKALLLVPQEPGIESSDGKVWHLKLPAYVNIEDRPYDAEYYRATLEDREEYRLTDPAKANAKMVGVKNTVRWKWSTGPDGEPVRQSNSRVIRWSDGTVSLQVGSEFFDISSSYGSTLARPQDPQPKARPVNPNAAATYLYRPVQEMKIFMAEREIAGQLSLLPTSMNSRTHIELIKSAGNANVKASKMRNLDEIGDAKRVQELLLKSAGDGSGTPAKRPRRPAGSGTKRGARRRKEVKYESGGSDHDSDGGGPRRRDKDEGEYDEDDGFVVGDDVDEEAEEEEDTDEAEYGASLKRKSKSKSKKSKKRRDREESLDEMEEAERRIEARERERKRAKGGAKDKAKEAAKKKSREYVDTEEEEEDAEGEEDMEMDMESEDD